MSSKNKHEFSANDGDGNDDDSIVNNLIDKMNEDKSNPFSFKNFISETDPTANGINKNQTESIPLPELLPDPDNLESPQKANEEPKNPFSYKQFFKKKPSEDDDIESILPTLPLSPATSALEHILPDCVDIRQHNENSTAKRKVLPNFSESTSNDAEKLRLENNKLKKQIESDQKQLDEQRALIKELEQRIKRLKDKELNENKALELMIQNVEKNLVITTERAVKSEKTVESLKLETKQLKSHIITLTNENTRLKQSKLNENQSSKLDDYANQLEFASNKAEVSLKELLSGLDTLKLLSSSLKSFGKITEINEN